MYPDLFLSVSCSRFFSSSLNSSILSDLLMCNKLVRFLPLFFVSVQILHSRGKSNICCSYIMLNFDPGWNQRQKTNQKRPENEPETTRKQTRNYPKTNQKRPENNPETTRKLIRNNPKTNHQKRPENEPDSTRKWTRNDPKTNQKLLENESEITRKRRYYDSF